jgi:hypothetical protein
MKRILPAIAILLLTLNGWGQTPVKAPISSDKMPEITFEHDSYDFGTVSFGKPAQHEFVFTNTGKTPLILSDVKASCGCTTPTWSKAPIAPGKTGSIIVAYDTKRAGMVEKKVTVTSNARTPVKEIRIKIHVLDGETPKPPDDLASPNPPGNLFDN